MIITKKKLTKIFESLYTIRAAEKKISEIYSTDKIKSPIHLSIGQEAIAVGICQNLKKSDLISNTYRSHASFLANGGSLKSFFSELYGKETGCAGGRGGSMHLVDIKNGILGSSAVVGTTIPVAAGYALKEKLIKKNNIVVCIFGDGATEEGCFYETLNFSALKKLPILFVCENNGLAIHTGLKKRWSKNNLTEKVKSFGIKSKIIEKPDVLNIYKISNKCINYVRKNKLPFFLEIKCLREYEHVGPSEDLKKKYRDKSYEKKFSKNLFSNNEFNKINLILKSKIKKNCDVKVKKAIQFAERSKFPAIKTIKNFIY